MGPFYGSANNEPEGMELAPLAVAPIDRSGETPARVPTLHRVERWHDIRVKRNALASFEPVHLSRTTPGRQRDLDLPAGID